MEMTGSWVAVMQVWLHGPQSRSGPETGNFGGNKNQDTRMRMRYGGLPMR